MKKLDQTVTNALDECADGLDAASLSRLRQARSKALEQPVSWWQRPASQWLSAAALATIAVVVTITVAIRPTDVNGPLDAAWNELEIAALQEDMDLLEDLEFYHWLDTVSGENDNT